MATFQELGYALRTLLKSRTFAGVSIFALALGIGASTAVFSVVNAVLLRPLPYESPEELETVVVDFPREGLVEVGLSQPEFIDLQEQNRVFSDVAAIFSTRVNLTGVDEPERLPVLYTSASFFPILRARAEHGRVYGPEEDSPGGNDVVVLSHRIWRNRFGADRGMVGERILLNETPHTVLGVMPEGFGFGDEESDLWVPIALDRGSLAPRTRHYLKTVARRAPGVSSAQAEADMDRLSQALPQLYPETYQAGSIDIDAVPLREYIVGNVRPALLILMGAILFVLLIACGNVANLLLVRAVTREREIAIRSALGAGRRRLFRQMMIESLVLSVVGGLAGLFLALASTRYLVSVGAGQIPRLAELTMDWRVLVFTLAASVVTGLLFGMVPAVQAHRPQLNDLLREGVPTSDRRRARLRSGLVVLEIAIALMLLIGAGLMVKSFLLLRDTDPGFNPGNVLSVQLLLPRSRYAEEAEQTAFFDRVVEGARTLPGVESAGAVSQLPLSEDYWSSSLLVEGKVLNQSTGHASVEVDWRTVTPGYFETLEVPLVQGRYFGETDNQDGQKVAIIDRKLAERVWPNEDPVGQRLQEASFTERKPWLTIVGVVESVKHYGLTTESRELVYLPQLQRATPFRSMSLVMRTSVPPETLVGPVRAKIREIDPNQPVSRIKTMDQLLAESIAKPRFYLFLLGIFSAVALILATIGVYGLISYAVSQRSHELSIRVALGSNRDQLARLVVGQGLVLAVTGLVIGLIAALASTRVLASLLYGVSVSDPIVYVLVISILGLVAFLASYIPARRASRVDPASVLRQT